MRPLGHRDPGPAGALLDRAGSLNTATEGTLTCEVVADGAYLHDTTIRPAARAAGPGGLVLITDAMAAAGMPDGDYRLGDLAVTVVAGVARLASGEAIAGSTATMDLSSAAP